MRGLIAGSAFQAKSSQAGVPVLLKANQLGCASWATAWFASFSTLQFRVNSGARYAKQVTWR